MRSIPTALAAAAAVALAAPAVASADSLVFVKDDNVWLANPDGSGQYQVTFDGTAEQPWFSPSQADDGTIVAARRGENGGPLHRMRQNGEPLGDIPLAPMQAGPFAPQVSPDGRLVAYEHVFSRFVNGYLETSSDVRFTRTDGSTDSAVFGETGRGAGAPSWIDSGRAFVGVNAVAMTQTVGQQAVQWWSDYDHQPRWFSNGESVEDGEVAPNGTVVVVRGEHDDNTIQLYSSTGSFTAPPTPTCTLRGPSDGPAGRRFADPTLSPSGDALAWQEGDGVWTMSLTPDCKRGVPRLLIAGASEPDWGPADVNPGPRPDPGAETPDVQAPGGETPADTTTDGPGDDGQVVPHRTARGCAALKRAKRDACRHRKAVAACRAGRRAKRRACLKRAHLAYAKRTCALKAKRGKARARCVAKAKRRYA